MCYFIDIDRSVNATKTASIKMKRLYGLLQFNYQIKIVVCVSGMDMYAWDLSSIKQWPTLIKWDHSTCETTIYEYQRRTQMGAKADLNKWFQSEICNQNPVKLDSFYYHKINFEKLSWRFASIFHNTTTLMSVTIARLVLKVTKIKWACAHTQNELCLISQN